MSQLAGSNLGHVLVVDLTCAGGDSLAGCLDLMIESHVFRHQKVSFLGMDQFQKYFQTTLNRRSYELRTAFKDRGVAMQGCELSALNRWLWGDVCCSSPGQDELASLLSTLAKHKADEITAELSQQISFQ